MKSQKINNYQLTGSIHTLQIKSSDIPEIPTELQECISSSTRKNHGMIEAISIINPNKLLGDCFSFTEFEDSSYYDEHYTSDSDSDSSYDWDSGDSWDSGTTDWDSDW